MYVCIFVLVSHARQVESMMGSSTCRDSAPAFSSSSVSHTTGKPNVNTETKWVTHDVFYL